MEIRVRATGAVMTEQAWRQWLLQNDGPSFGQLTPEIMDELGADPVFEGPQATGGDRYQFSMRDGVEQIGGKWYTKYVLGPVFYDIPAEGDRPAQTAAEQEAAYRARKDDEFAAANVAQAKTLLVDTDWSELPSVRNTDFSPHLVNGEDYDLYRLALRAIVLNAPPTVLEWPVKPESVWA